MKYKSATYTKPWIRAGKRAYIIRTIARGKSASSGIAGQ